MKDVCLFKTKEGFKLTPLQYITPQLSDNILENGPQQRGQRFYNYLIYLENFQDFAKKRRNTYMIESTWPNEYSGDLNKELDRYSNGSKLFDQWMVPYSDHHLNNELKVRYSGHGLNNELKVRYSNGCNLFWNLSRNLSFSLCRFVYKNNFYL